MMDNTGDKAHGSRADHYRHHFATYLAPNSAIRNVSFLNSFSPCSSSVPNLKVHKKPIGQRSKGI